MSVAPAARVGTATISSVWETIAFSEIALADLGRPILSKAFSNADLTLVANAVARVCDSKDGVKDGLIFDTRDCRFDPADADLKGRKMDTLSFSEPGGRAEESFAGPKNSRGEALYRTGPMTPVLPLPAGA